MVDIGGGRSTGAAEASFSTSISLEAAVEVRFCDLSSIEVHRARIAAFATAHRLPSMFGWREYCDAGGLLSYGANQRATYVRLAAYADHILRGEAPGGLPVEQPTAFELVINLKAAKAIGVDIPPALLARADEVIE